MKMWRAGREQWWPDDEHAGEFDGIGKYVDPELLRGRAPRQALIEEKDREDELRRVVRGSRGGGRRRWTNPLPSTTS